MKFEFIVKDKEYSLDNSHFYENGGIAFQIFEGWELYTHLNVNLEGYGMTPVRNCIFINHDLVKSIGCAFESTKFESVTQAILNEIVKPDGVFLPIEYGYANSVMVELKEEYFVQ